MIRLYIAASLDGYIARKDGSLDWLNDHPNPDKLDYGYSDFISEVDLVVMGRKTYEEILGFDTEWPYSKCTTYVLTSVSDYIASTPKTVVINSLDDRTVKSLKEKAQKDIWVCGGGEVIASFINIGVVDRIELFIVPIILGDGIPLFRRGIEETSLSLEKVTSHPNGMVAMNYKKD